MRQKGFTPILVVIILALIGVIGAYYFGAQKDSIFPKPTQIPTSVATNTPTQITPTTKPTADPTVNWKTYTNTKYLYSFKYPQQYGLKNNNSEGYDNNISTSTQLEVFSSNNEPNLVFAVYIESINTDFDTYANSLFTTFSTFKFPQSDKDYKNPLGNIEDNGVAVPIKKEVLNSMNAYTFSIKGNFIGNAGLPTKTALTTKYILLNSSGMVYILKLLNPTNDTNLLLNTFKFTQ